MCVTLTTSSLAFRVDKDRSGAISSDELQQALSNGACDRHVFDVSGIIASASVKESSPCHNLTIALSLREIGFLTAS